MDKPIVRVFADAEQVSLAASVEFVRCARAALAARGRFTVALSGGSTPRRLFELLAAPPLRDQLDWPRIDFFWGDERSVPADHADSNYRMASEAMFSKTPVARERIHRLQGDLADLESAACAY